ncbi:hypothetical protein AXF42_Ash020321 [Apostasia shenzhenica]|uniref:Uncharacterized protein n=1 Tax=Apostasia shenzhenica TaxID=1088818 RepID=A0A2I0B0P0_9ASPA|nr:hypothetical protein AXF42_Ash020321 [Apostasia shenzhenica]
MELSLLRASILPASPRSRPIERVPPVAEHAIPFADNDLQDAERGGVDNGRDLLGFRWFLSAWRLVGRKFIYPSFAIDRFNERLGFKSIL